jgi:thioredoxin-related protein
MNTRNRSLAFLLFLTLTGWLFPAENKTPWETDYAAAIQRAKAENKLLLLNFTGSDWCAPCRRLHQEIFETPEMAAYGRTRLVMVYLDFPRSTPVPPEVKIQNALLARVLAVESFPTVFIITPDGARLGSLGYMEGGPKTFIRAIERLAAKWHPEPAQK